MSRKRIWTTGQIEVLRANFANMSTKDMVALINDPKIGINQVNAKGSQLGLKKSQAVLNRSYSKNMDAINTKKKANSGKIRLVRYRIIEPEKPVSPEGEEKDREKFNEWYYSDVDKPLESVSNRKIHLGKGY